MLNGLKFDLMRQAWQCSPGKEAAWNVLSLFTASGMLCLEISLLAFLLQEDYSTGLDALAHNFVVSGIVVGVDMLLKVIFGISLQRYGWSFSLCNILCLCMNCDGFSFVTDTCIKKKKKKFCLWRVTSLWYLCWGLSLSGKSHAPLFTSDQIYGYGPSCGIALQILPCYLKHCNFTVI